MITARFLLVSLLVSVPAAAEDSKFTVLPGTTLMDLIRMRSKTPHQLRSHWRIVAVLATVALLATSAQAQPGRSNPTPVVGPLPLPILAALPTRSDASFYAVQDVPSGTVERTTYKDLSGEDKRMHVYLPPGYHDSDATYPVLYLNHGGGGDDTRWTATDKDGGHAHLILDNLIAALDKFSELYVYNSGYIQDKDRAEMKENFASFLSDNEANKRFNVPMFFAAGETDIALNNNFKTMAIFNAASIRTFAVLSDGGHDFNNWRRYLWQSAQVMFPGSN